VEALNCGVGENIMQWCQGGRRHVGQKSLIEVQHAQKSTEITGGLGWVVVLEMGHSFFQRLGTLVTEEGGLGYLGNALCWVDEDPVPLKLVEESP
jgi:hypothetical protein